ncbi:hypothetical protein D3C72_1354170 [compost metagenome]
MHTPAIEYFWQMNWIYRCRHEPGERVPVVASLCFLVSITAQLSSFMTVDNGEMGNVAGMDEKDRIPCRLDICVNRIRSICLVLVSIDYRRETGLLEEGRDCS